MWWFRRVTFPSIWLPAHFDCDLSGKFVAKQAWESAEQGMGKILKTGEIRTVLQKPCAEETFGVSSINGAPTPDSALLCLWQAEPPVAEGRECGLDDRISAKKGLRCFLLTLRFCELDLSCQVDSLHEDFSLDILTPHFLCTAKLNGVSLPPLHISVLHGAQRSGFGFGH